MDIVEIVEKNKDYLNQHQNSTIFYTAINRLIQNRPDRNEEIVEIISFLCKIIDSQESGISTLEEKIRKITEMPESCFWTLQTDLSHNTNKKFYYTDCKHLILADNVNHPWKYCPWCGQNTEMIYPESE